jgi:hypothetical protein
MARKKIKVVLSLAADKGALIKTLRRRKSRRRHRRHRKSRK